LKKDTIGHIFTGQYYGLHLNLILQGNDKNIMLGGDFSYSDIDWSNLHVKSQAQDID
jgi:hypothetical protein